MAAVAMLESSAWSGIDEQLQRLNRALSGGDLPLAVGTCKDLAESVEKVVLAARGETTASNARFPKLMTSAQAVLERQPGRGLAADQAIRLAAQTALKMINYLPELRPSVSIRGACRRVVGVAQRERGSGTATPTAAAVGGSRLSPLKHANLNVRGRYSFRASAPAGGSLRPLRDPATADTDEEEG